LGGGYSGLWTAYYLLRHEPALRVAVVEKEIAGFGGSGRNGGWCSPNFPVTAGALEKRFGAETARNLLLTMRASVDEVGRVCAEEKIDAHFHNGGVLTLARGQHQLSGIRSSYAAYERLGLSNRYQLLSAPEAGERIRVTDVYGGLYTPDGASLHPARLVRGVARAVEARGGIIYEQTQVTSFKAGSLLTPGGELRAKRAIVLAGEAYLTRLPRLHRALLPVYSLISLTEPLTARQWSQIGWQNGESVASTRNTVVYLTKTRDGRILFGSRGAPYVFGSKITDQQDTHEATLKMIQRSLMEWFPSLTGIGFTHAWGGPVGMPRDWMPAVSFDAHSRMGSIMGYTGQGVSTSNLAGRLLAGLIMNRKTGLEMLPLAQRRSPKWEIEPVRWLVVRYMQNAFMRIDEAAEAGRPRPVDARLAEHLGRH
ncbi:NAD(P)/FAD-dependent oxidoreductase, partial [Bradyrhizobium sp.]|uniref:NAD(P)/FAD-dependent oxidoreductase n=1 Tax=Bradyrhizobium sp. TaxID=376 RepID=UPI003C5A3FC1